MVWDHREVSTDDIESSGGVVTLSQSVEISRHLVESTDTLPGLTSLSLSLSLSLVRLLVRPGFGSVVDIPS